MNVLLLKCLIVMINYNNFSKEYMEINDNLVITKKELELLYEIWIKVNISFNKIKKKKKKWIK